MQTGKDLASKMRSRGVGIMSAAALAASLGMLALGGCSSQNADQPPATPPSMVNFDLAKCQQIEANLYKCPAVDRPMCTPEFNRTDVNCVRIGPKGSVFVMRGDHP